MLEILNVHNILKPLSLHFLIIRNNLKNYTAYDKLQLYFDTFL